METRTRRSDVIMLILCLLKECFLSTRFDFSTCCLHSKSSITSSCCRSVFIRTIHIHFLDFALSNETKFSLYLLNTCTIKMIIADDVNVYTSCMNMLILYKPSHTIAHSTTELILFFRSSLSAAILEILHTIAHTLAEISFSFPRLFCIVGRKK